MLQVKVSNLFNN